MKLLVEPQRPADPADFRRLIPDDLPDRVVCVNGSVLKAARHICPPISHVIRVSARIQVVEDTRPNVKC